MKKRGKSHSVDTVFVLTLFCAFATCVLLVLVLGTKAYSAVRNESDETYSCRTALSYISQKLHHSDHAGSVTIGEHCGAPALILGESYDGVLFNTFIYYYDGNVYELLCEEGLDLDIDAGNPILPAGALSFEKTGENLLKITYTDANGLTESALVSLRSKGALQ